MTALLFLPVLICIIGCIGGDGCRFWGGELAVPTCFVCLVPLVTSGKATRQTLKGLIMSEESTSKSTFGGTPQRVFFLVYGLEGAESGPVGAVDVGKMDSFQLHDFRKECLKLCNGQYRVGFHSDELLTGSDEFYVPLRNYDRLEADQKKAIDNARYLAKQVRRENDSGLENVEEPPVMPPTDATGTEGKRKTKAKSGPRPKQAPTRGRIHAALLVLFHENEKMKNKTAEELAEILVSRRRFGIKKCSKSAVKGTYAWVTYCSPLRRREKTNSLENLHRIRDDQSQEPWQILAAQSEQEMGGAGGQ